MTSPEKERDGKKTGMQDRKKRSNKGRLKDLCRGVYKQYILGQMKMGLDTSATDAFLS